MKYKLEYVIGALGLIIITTKLAADMNIGGQEFAVAMQGPPMSIISFFAGWMLSFLAASIIVFFLSAIVWSVWTISDWIFDSLQ